MPDEPTDVTADGEPKLLDCGIAKLLHPDAADADMTQTLVANRILTPQYASPEQVLGEPVSTATDVHALGLLLYELLCGCRARAIDSTQPRAIEQAVCDTEPTAPSLACVAKRPTESNKQRPNPAEIAAARRLSLKRLQRQLRGDLDNIIMMALRREPERRYATAQQLADDIRNVLAKRPVRALSVREAHFGPDHVHVADSLNDLGVVLKDLGDYAAGEAALTRAVDLRRELPYVRFSPGSLLRRAAAVGAIG